MPPSPKEIIGPIIIIELQYIIVISNRGLKEMWSSVS